MEIVDANIILRFIIDDNQELADKAAEIIENRNIYLLEEVMAEVIYVLEKVYKMERKEITDIVLEFIRFDNIIINNEEVMRIALKLFGEKRFDFVDCILYGYSKYRNSKIHTFDKKLQKIINSI